MPQCVQDWALGFYLLFLTLWGLQQLFRDLPCIYTSGFVQTLGKMNYSVGAKNLNIGCTLKKYLFSQEYLVISNRILVS